MDSKLLTNLLLIGVDRKTDQPVVNIINYLRKFALKERLEIFVKHTLTNM